MELTEDHNKFILESYFRTGVCDRDNGSWWYSQELAEKFFRERFPEVNIDATFRSHVVGIVDRFRATGSVYDFASKRRSPILSEEDLRRRIAAYREENPGIGLQKLAVLTGVSAKVVKRITEKVHDEGAETDNLAELRIEDLKKYDFTVLCEVCGKQLANSKKLHVHRRLHKGLKPYACERCGKCFAKSEALKEHIRVHTGEKPFRCGVCGRAFSQRSPLKIHERLHSGERPYKCRFCDRRFISKASTDMHMKTSCKG